MHAHIARVMGFANFSASLATHPHFSFLFCGFILASDLHVANFSLANYVACVQEAGLMYHTWHARPGE